MEQVLATAQKLWQSLPLFEQLAHNGTFWVGVSFVGLCALLLYYRVPAMLAKGLDAQRDVIAKDLDEAQQLYSKAVALLAEHQAKLDQQGAEGLLIMARARQQAKDYHTEQESAIKEKLARLEAQAKQRIEQEKKQALEHLYRESMALAVTEAQKLVAERANHDALIEQAIQEIEASLNKKPSALH